MFLYVLVLSAMLLLAASTPLRAQGMKVIVDQDARGPATMDLQSILVFLQSKRFDVLGITTVSGDQWMKEETAHALRLLEIAGRADVPVVEGAEFPLLNSKMDSNPDPLSMSRREFLATSTAGLAMNALAKDNPTRGVAAATARPLEVLDLLAGAHKGRPYLHRIEFGAPR